MTRDLVDGINPVNGPAPDDCILNLPAGNEHFGVNFSRSRLLGDRITFNVTSCISPVIVMTIIRFTVCLTDEFHPRRPPQCT